MAKNIIWCEVTCGACGGLAAASGFYSPERIKLIKRQTKDWIEDDLYGCLCPSCAESLGRAKKKRGM